MSNYEIKHRIDEKRKTLIHGPSASGIDYTLCNLALEGDGSNYDDDTWYAAVNTMKPISCPECKAIIAHCLRLSKSK